MLTLAESTLQIYIFFMQKVENSLSTAFQFVSLNTFSAGFDELFNIRKTGPDVIFKQWVPAIYEKHGIQWREFFEPDFCDLFNGLMIRGKDQIGSVFLCAFPSAEILEKFFNLALPGDLLFTHHPIDYLTGQNESKLGSGFEPISEKHLSRFKEGQYSFYSCHAPLDYNPKISTTGSIASALSLTNTSRFCGEGDLKAGIVGNISPASLNSLELKLKAIFDIDYIDRAGPAKGQVSRVAIIAGEATNVDYLKEAEDLGAEVFIAGEFKSYAAGSWGEKRRQDFDAFLPRSKMSYFGVSHGASEFLVFKNEISSLIQEKYPVGVFSLAEKNWWGP